MKETFKRPIHRKGAKNAKDQIFPLAEKAANGKPLIALAKTSGSYIKSASADFMKNYILRVLCAFAVKKD
ncbi:MAG: hypothetical protein MUF69_02290 [Desulfobacterota bacterium]|nr:hypothetical protein [Thermodesulfobacteriota bacterium]